MNLKNITPKEFFDTLSVPARNVTFWRRIVLHLSLLHHAARCKEQEQEQEQEADQQGGEEGTRATTSPPSCCVTPRCQETKKLWKHLANCKDSKCIYPSCIPSRMVLSHHHQCQKDSTRDGCPSSMPKRLHERWLSLSRTVESTVLSAG